MLVSSSKRLARSPQFKIRDVQLGFKKLKGLKRNKPRRKHGG
jgi:hypothetical protein